MTDATRLRTGLEAYLSALRRQQSELRQQGERLEGAWHLAREHYQGTGAEVFADAYERSRRMVQEYEAAADAIIPVLEARLEALDRFDAIEDGNL